MSSEADSKFHRLFENLFRNQTETTLDRITNTRGARFENLEDRLVLTASGFDVAVEAPVTLAQTAYVTDLAYSNTASVGEVHATADQPAVITQVQLKVNGEPVTIHSGFDTLRVNAGDTVEVVGIGYEVHASINAEGVFAAEGYLNHLGAGDEPGTTDYSDGRFSERQTNPAVAVGDGQIQGLDGVWQVNEGTDRMSVALVHYFGDQSAQMSTFGIRLQVGDPDFVVDPSVAEQFFGRDIELGGEVQIEGGWLNAGDGRYNNHSEVDIYNAQTGELEWVGTIAGNGSADDPVIGEYLNSNPDDNFAERWVPTEATDYVLKFHADPENTWNETDETNNVIEVRLTVVDPDPVADAVDDAFSGAKKKDFNSLDVLSNDQGRDLQLVEFGQGEHGKVKLNKDGSLKYTPKGKFQGTDSFTYTVIDAEGNRDMATVTVELLGKHSIGAEKLAGLVGERLKLDISLRTDAFDAISITGLPRSMQLSGGAWHADGSYRISTDALDNFTVQSEEAFKSRLKISGVQDGHVINSTSTSVSLKIRDLSGESDRSGKSELHGKSHLSGKKARK